MVSRSQKEAAMTPEDTAMVSERLFPSKLCIVVYLFWDTVS